MASVITTRFHGKRVFIPVPMSPTEAFGEEGAAEMRKKTHEIAKMAKSQEEIVSFVASVYDQLNKASASPKPLPPGSRAGTRDVPTYQIAGGQAGSMSSRMLQHVQQVLATQAPAGAPQYQIAPGQQGNVTSRAVQQVQAGLVVQQSQVKATTGVTGALGALTAAIMATIRRATGGGGGGPGGGGGGGGGGPFGMFGGRFGPVGGAIGLVSAGLGAMSAVMGEAFSASWRKQMTGAFQGLAELRKGEAATIELRSMQNEQERSAMGKNSVFGPETTTEWMTRLQRENSTVSGALLQAYKEGGPRASPFPEYEKQAQSTLSEMAADGAPYMSPLARLLRLGLGRRGFRFNKQKPLKDYADSALDLHNIPDEGWGRPRQKKTDQPDRQEAGEADDHDVEIRDRSGAPRNRRRWERPQAMIDPDWLKSDFTELELHLYDDIVRRDFGNLNTQQPPVNMPSVQGYV